MTRTRIAGLTMAVLLAAGACDDSSTDVVGDALTEAEAAALAEVVAGTLFSAFESSAPATAPARVSGTLSFDDQLPCELGGSVAVSADIAYNFNDLTGDGTLDYTVTEAHDDCVAESESGIEFTLNGAPNISADFLVTFAGDNITFAGGYDGSVAWATEDKSGTCGVDVDFSLMGNLQTSTGTATISGSVCGVNFNSQLSLT